jgi:hypothetical protein
MISPIVKRFWRFVFRGNFVYKSNAKTYLGKMKLKFRETDKEVRAVRVLWFCKNCATNVDMCYKCQNAPLEIVTDAQMIEIIDQDRWSPEVACEAIEWANEIEGRVRCQIGAVLGYRVLIARFTDENDRLHFKFRWS